MFDHMPAPLAAAREPGCDTAMAQTMGCGLIAEDSRSDVLVFLVRGGVTALTEAWDLPPHTPRT